MEVLAIIGIRSGSKGVINKNIKTLKLKYNKIYGFGAPAKATPVLNYFNIANYFNGIIEDNYLKNNKYVP